MKMVNRWAEICHLLIKFNSDFFLQKHAKDKLSISVNRNSSEAGSNPPKDELSVVQIKGTQLPYKL